MRFIQPLIQQNSLMLVLLSERMSTFTFLGYFTFYNCPQLCLELLITIIVEADYKLKFTKNILLTLPHSFYSQNSLIIRHFVSINIMNYLVSDESNQFFNPAIDTALIVTAIVSSIISLTIPWLYYFRKQCRQHPTVLIANISLLQAMANFNIILMGYNLYGFQSFINIRSVFHSLTFNLGILPDINQQDFCITNYYIYMLFELISISFHLCYSVDLFITLKYPFYSGKKRRKIYYLFSFLFPIITLTTSISQAEELCNDLKKQSIYLIPFTFLICLLVFVGVSLAIIFMSFFTKHGQSDIRKSYIRQHRATLFALVFLWICPIWVNLSRIVFDDTDSQQFQIANILAFFSIVSSSGIVALVRIFYDKYIRKRIITMLSVGKKKDRQSTLITDQASQEARSENANADQIWNLPLSGAMNQFQSQQIVHNIIQVVCQACAHSNNPNGRHSNYRQSFTNNQSALYESVYRNTVQIEEDLQTVQQNLFDLIFKERNQRKIDKKDPNECDIKELKELCKRKRKFNMVCTTHSKICPNVPDSRLKQKTVKIRSLVSEEEFDQHNSMEIKVTSYSHRVFQSLRVNQGFSSQRIQNSLDLQKNINNIKKAKQSLGASGSFFFFSYDKSLVIKTITQEQREKMIQILPHYFQHIRYNDNSLLARIYGVFAVEISEISKIYFLMMENTLKDFDINNIEYKLYDLKGSTIQREVKETNAPVLKDINYFHSANCFIYMTRQNKMIFIDRITKDLQVLKKFNIMDYSLLLAVGKSKYKRKKSQLHQCSESDVKEITNYRYINGLQSVTKRLYSIAIIDFLQEFNTQKKTELWLKRLFKGGGDISSVDTQIYFQRFMNFIKRITLVMNINQKKYKTSTSKSQNHM